MKLSKLLLLFIVSCVIGFTPVFADMNATLTGGWEMTPNLEITDDAKAAFENATVGYEDPIYSPLALLGTQVVSGTNYCFLCRATSSEDGVDTSNYVLVYVYQDLTGNAEVLDTQLMELGIEYEEDETLFEDETFYEETTPAEPANDGVEPTMGEKNALSAAESYISIMAFSYDGLIKQLKYEGYSESEATYAADHCGADWQEQALKSAVNYVDIMAFSHDGLIKQLKYEGYSDEDAAYAADNCGADWKEQAAKAAANYIDLMSFSRDGLIQQLEYEGYTAEEAQYGADAVGY